jgi:hypothetical protein
MTASVKIEIRMRREVVLSHAAAQRIAGRSGHGSAGTPEMRVNQGK